MKTPITTPAQPVPQCYAEVWTSFPAHQCSRKAVCERDGKPYCKQHDPVAVEARREAKQAKWDKESAEAKQRAQKADAKDKFADAAMASYTAHCADPVAAAESDLLGEALKLAKRVAKSLAHKPNCICDNCYNIHASARAILAKAGEGQGK